MKVGFRRVLGPCLAVAALSCTSAPAPTIAPLEAETPGGGIGGAERSAGDGGSARNDACASLVVESRLAPVDLVFAFDRSGSMDDQDKWGACSAGLEAFFASPATHGFRASLQYFPLTLDWCNASAYATPAVTMTALPDATTFAHSIDATEPISDRGTPTLPALEGAIRYADFVLAAEPTHRVAVVLVTDGEPRDCGSTVDGVSARAAAARARVPTFVVGVGGSQNLDVLAWNGGTDKPSSSTRSTPPRPAPRCSMRSRASAARSAATFRSSANEPIDPFKVNVTLSTGGQSSGLAYDPSCGTTSGWHYDAPDAPHRIVLCPTTCAAAARTRPPTSRSPSAAPPRP
ncbi:MAG: vWA domain-containing protein [Polyangiaceae bacterium]